MQKCGQRQDFVSGGRQNQGGFTLLEVVIASGILALLISASLVAFTQINRFANAARLQTMALAVAQQRIDEVLTTSWDVTRPRPAVLVAGTQTETNLALNDDALNSASGLSSAYTGLDVPVLATRTTAIGTLTSRTVSAVVTVTYIYRSRTYSISLRTLRSTDNI